MEILREPCGTLRNLRGTLRANLKGDLKGTLGEPQGTLGEPHGTLGRQAAEPGGAGGSHQFLTRARKKKVIGLAEPWAALRNLCRTSKANLNGNLKGTWRNLAEPSRNLKGKPKGKSEGNLAEPSALSRQAAELGGAGGRHQFYRESKDP